MGVKLIIIIILEDKMGHPNAAFLLSMADLVWPKRAWPNASSKYTHAWNIVKINILWICYFYVRQVSFDLPAS